MKRGIVSVVALCALVAGRLGEAQHRATVDDPEAEGVVPRGEDSALVDALAARFTACHEAESGPLSAGDRDVLRSALAPVAAPLAGTLESGGCEGEAARGRGVEAVRELSCDELARALAEMPARMARGEAPAWAAGYARVVARRVVDCYAAEVDGGALDDETRRAMEGFEAQTASALGAVAQRPGCAANENLLPACGASAQRVSCEALGAVIAQDPSRVRDALGEDCRRLVQCEGDGEDAAVDLEALGAEGARQ